ncbi:MAG: superoxide dismutase [Candidatus Riflebacteria bacterium]|nr:superoxide dismutase [Candidatus Riflebacteria bacterium]
MLKRFCQRNFLILVIFIPVVLSSYFSQVQAQEKSPLVLEPLPFAQDALEPFISSHTLGFHYGKHHAAYVDKANELLKGNPLASKSIEEIIKETAGKSDQVPLFNAVAQSWNHAFFWKCLKPKSTGKPEGKIAKMIDDSFGSYDKFKEEFVKTGVSLFGSGWVWLVLDGEKLQIVKGFNAETPLTKNQKPLFVIDVWEHAYYLDFQNRRSDYLKAILENLVNWDFVASNL